MLTGNIYGIHIKDKNTCLSKDNPHICIDWSIMGDLSSYDTREKLEKAHLASPAFASDSKNSRANQVGQLHRFVNETQIGDYVLFSRDGGIHIGKIVSDYYFNNGQDASEDSGYRNVRKVEWIKHVSINAFSEEFKNSIGSFMSYFSMSKYVDEVENVLNDNYLQNNESFLRLKGAKDIDPFKYDGSYLLTRKVVEAYKGINFNLLDNKDIELIYFSTIGTWRSSFQNKKERTLNSNLPNAKKEELVKLIEKLEQDTNNQVYEHSTDSGSDKPVMGMFGTGFGSFKKTPNEAIKKLIKLFVEVADCSDEVECLELVKQTLTEEIRGIKTGVLTTILHCLQPCYFPIINGSNQGDAKSLYSKLGILIINPIEITSYIDNVYRIKDFRDTYFNFKNYRVLDIESWNEQAPSEDVKVIDCYNNEEGIFTCNSGLTSKEWETLLTDKELTSEAIIEILKAWYSQENHEASCKQISVFVDDENKGVAYYNLVVTGYCKSVCKKLKIKINDEDNNRYFPILMDGRNAIYEGSKVYNWILKDEVVEALEALGLVSVMVEEVKQVYDTYTKEDFLKKVFIDEEQYQDIYEQLIRKKNIILKGTPGVGKTFMAKELAYSFIGEKNNSVIEMIQFHQSYSYEDFIFGYQPTEDGTFKLTPGIFYSFCKKAEKNKDVPHFFIIDEINRGNLSKIFGELFMLIENDKRGKQHLTLSHTKEAFSVPENLYIIGMMNTADRSLAIVDYALRRRFSFISVKPAFENPKFRKYLLDNGTDESLVQKIIDRFTELNKVITDDVSLGEDFAIGHSYFCDSKKQLTEKTYNDIVKYDIKPILEEYWFDNKDKAEQRLKELLK